MLVLLQLLLLASAAYGGPEDATITSGVIWNTTNGEPVHAHGAGVYAEGAPTVLCPCIFQLVLVLSLVAPLRDPPHTTSFL